MKSIKSIDVGFDMMKTKTPVCINEDDFEIDTDFGVIRSAGPRSLSIKLKELGYNVKIVTTDSP